MRGTCGRLIQSGNQDHLAHGLVLLARMPRMRASCLRERKPTPPPPQTKSPRFKTLLRYSSYTFEYQEAQMPNQTAEFLIPESYHASPGLSQKFWTGRTVP